MTLAVRKVLLFILKVASDKVGFFFWLFIRFVSAILPLITIYLFSLVVRQLELKADFDLLLSTVLLTLIVRLVDNYLRLLSITRLENVIGHISFDIHNFFLRDLQLEAKVDRHAAIQAIRNFADASSLTLNLIKQPGIDSLVSFIFIPTILLFVDFPSFIITLAYISTYYAIDHYTTQRYGHLRDILNTKTEVYYAKLQDSNDFDLEQSSYSRHFNRLVKWGFTEWSALQHTAVSFYCLLLIYLVYSVSLGQKDISTLVLIVGYTSQTQVFLNSFSHIQDSLTDMLVGLKHLAANHSLASLNLSNLV
jgi:hypothetical protein